MTQCSRTHGVVTRYFQHLTVRWRRVKGWRQCCARAGALDYSGKVLICLPKYLSTRQRQRVAIARVACRKPKA